MSKVKGPLLSRVSQGQGSTAGDLTTARHIGITAEHKLAPALGRFIVMCVVVPARCRCHSRHHLPP